MNRRARDGLVVQKYESDPTIYTMAGDIYVMPSDTKEANKESPFLSITCNRTSIYPNSALAHANLKDSHQRVPLSGMRGCTPSVPNAIFLFSMEDYLLLSPETWYILVCR